MELINRLKYIFKLIIKTPYYGWIILFNLVSAGFTFAGIPLLLPALEYLRTDMLEERSLGYMGYVGRGFGLVGLEANFYSIVMVAAVFIFMGQMLLLFIGLFNKRVQIKMINNYMHELITRYYRANWMWISRDGSGRFHSAVSREAGAASEAHLDAQRMLTSLLQVVIYVMIALLLSATVTMWATVFFSGILLVNVKYADRINAISRKYNDAFISLSSLVSGLTQNKKFFKASKNYVPFMNIITGQVEKVYRINWALTIWDGALRTFTTMAGMAFLIMIFLFHSLWNINLSELIILLVVFNRLSPEFTRLAGNYTRISERIPIHESVNNRIRELKAEEELTGREDFVPGKTIRFDDVSFGYNKDRMVLRNIDVEIRPLRATAIVGGSGAGKSTLLDLFLGLLKPDLGTVYYSDIPHDDLNIHTLRNKVAYVSQETTLIEGSLLYNLTITNPEADEDKVREACRKAMIDELIDELPEGVHTGIGENGIKLSGGQRQRVALARALMMDPEVLILDEATSQLDSETEAYIWDAIRRLHNELTIIIVAHRLSTVKFADRVYVLENGCILETGTYEELLEQEGRLYQLDSLQHG